MDHIVSFLNDGRVLGDGFDYSEVVHSFDEDDKEGHEFDRSLDGFSLF